MTMGVVFLNGVGVVRLFVGDCISSVPLGFKMNSTGVPIINFSGDSVHGIDLFHEGNGDSSRKEVDEGIFMGNFTKGDMVLELRHVVPRWGVL